MRIRDALFSDCSAISFIYNEYLGTKTLDLDIRDDAYFMTIISAKKERELFLVIEAQETNGVIGWARLMLYSYKSGYARAGETSLFIHREYLEKGYGSALKKHIILKARELGYHHLVARIIATNRKSIQYNLSLGYEKVGIQKNIGYVNEAFVDVQIMQLIL